MTTLGSMFKGGKIHIPGVGAFPDSQVIVTPAGRANGKTAAQPLDLLGLAAHVYGQSLTSSATAAAYAGVSLREIVASLDAWTNQDDDAHEPCSLTACRHPLHPGPCKGWKGTLHAIAPGTYRQLEEERVRKANGRRLQRIADLKAANKPIPRKLLEEIKPKAAPAHPAHGAQAVPLGQVGQKADLAGGQAHHAGQAVSNAAGVQVKTAPPLPLGPKAKKPTVAGRGPAFVITQPKVTDQYKLDKAAKITAQEWNDLTPGDKKAIRDELAAIKVRGFGPQQTKADALLAKLPPASTIGNLPAGTPGTITTPSGKTYQKVSLTPGKTTLGQATKTVTPASSAPAAPPAAPTSAGKGGKFLHTVEYNGQKYTRTSAHHYTHVSIVQKGHSGEKVVWGFHGSEANARATPLTSSQKRSGFRVVDALPVKREQVGGKSGTPATAPPAPSAPAAPSAPPTAKPGVLSPAAQHARAVAGRAVGGRPTAKLHLDAYGRLSKDEFESLDGNTQRFIRDDLANAKAKFLDPKKQQAAQDLLDRFGSRHASPAPGRHPAAAPSATMAERRVKPAAFNKASMEMKDQRGSWRTVATVETTKPGTSGALVTQHVFRDADGKIIQSATPNKSLDVRDKAPSTSAPAHPKGYSDPVAQAISAAHGTDDADVLKRVGQLSHSQIDTLDAADKKTVMGRLAFIATHPKADQATKDKAAALGRSIVTGKPDGMPKLDHEPTLNEVHAHQVKTGHLAQTKALEAADNTTGDRADRVAALAGLTKAHFDALNPQQQRRVTDALQGVHHENSGYGKTHDAVSTMAEDAITKYTGDRPAVARTKQAEADFRAGKIDARKLHAEILHARVQAPPGPIHDRVDKEMQRIAEDNPSLPLWLRSTLINNPYGGARGNPYDVISQLSMEHSWKDAPRLSPSDFQSLFRSTDADLAGSHPIHVEAVKKYREHVVHSGLADSSPWSTATKGQLVDSLTNTGTTLGPVVTDDRMRMFRDLHPADQVKVRTVLADRILAQTRDRAKTETDITLRQLQGHPYTGEKLDAALAATGPFPGPSVQDTYRKLPPADFQSFPQYTQNAIKDHLAELQTRAERNGPTLTWTPQSNALKDFPAALAAHLDGSRTEYMDRRLRNASDIANYGQKVINPFDRIRVYADVTASNYSNLSGPDRAKVEADLDAIAAAPSNTLSVRYGALLAKDIQLQRGMHLNVDQMTALASANPTAPISDAHVVGNLHRLSKPDFDQLAPAYREAIDERIKGLSGPDQQFLNAKFHPAAATPTPSGYTPTTVQTNVQTNVPPHVQAALDTIYGAHPKSHTMAHQLSTYGALRGSDFHQLNAQEQSHLLSDLSFIETTAKGPSADKARKLIDRFTPAGTAPGQIPTQPAIPPANAVPGQQRYATPLKGVLVKAADTGKSGDGWITTPGGKRVWGSYGAAGLLVKHVDPHTGETRFLMVQRGPAISDPGKWTFPGGAIDSKETPHQGAARETIEELGLKGDQLKDAAVHGDHTFSIPGSNWKYTTVAAQVDKQFQPDLSTPHARAETSDAKWMTLDEIRALDKSGKLHAPIANGLLEKNVISLYPAGGVTLGQVVRPGPVTRRQQRLGMPHGGRQAPQQFNAWPHAHKPSTGKNLVGDKPSIDKLRQDVKHARVTYDGKTGDGRLAAIGAMQGYDATPTVVDRKEMDRLLATGDYIEAWRGVKGAYGSKSAADINEDMRSGTAWYGRGIFGNGYYLATQRHVAEKYADGRKNSVMRILIPKSAVTEHYKKIQTEARANSSRTSKAKGNRYEEGTLYDAGRWAAAKGVDGIEITHDTVNDTSGWAQHIAKPGQPAFNWLNRSVLIIQEADK